MENRELQKVENPVVVQDTGMFANLLDTSRFKQMYSVAKLFAASELVPKQYQGHAANCMVALQMAFRMQVDPMMFMQNTYIVQGRPGIEAKLAIALVNSRGPFTGPIQWKFDGDGKNRKCIAFAVHKITGETCEAEVSWSMVEAEGWASKAGSKWKSIPDLMFRYRTAMFLARLYCPEVLLGMHSVDELNDIQPLDVGQDKGLADQVRLSSPKTEDIDKIAKEIIEANSAGQPSHESQETESSPQAIFYHLLGDACNGDEGAMLKMLHDLTGNHGLELCMIHDFNDDSIAILMDKLNALRQSSNA